MTNNYKKAKPSLEALVRSIHKDSRKEARDYFNHRGINSASIDKFMLGVGEIEGHYGYLIPVLNRDGQVAYVKLRRTQAADNIAQTMGEEDAPPKYTVYPENADPVLVGEDELIKSTSSDALICKGELDRIVAIQEGVKMPVVACGGAVQSFKNDWFEKLSAMRNIYVCIDSSGVGKLGAERLAKRLAEAIPAASIYVISLPQIDDKHIDLSDYFAKKYGTADELFTKYAKYNCGAKPIDVSQFKEMSVADVADVLDSTIKNNRVNKVITFLAMLLAYTDDSQLNVMYNAQSSTGKTYITLEVAKYFPSRDVKIYGRTSKTAFYYNESLMKCDKDNRSYIDLERRILVFAEQPDMQLLENLRSFLSHDLKKTPFVLTNKNKSGKNTASESYILGFATTIFCSANLRIDEQEQTRSLILSPESTEETVMAGVDESIARNSNKGAYLAKLDNNADRRSLMDRILFVKNLNIGQIDIDDSDYLRARFYKKLRSTPPRIQRQIGHFISLVKGVALLNAPFRMVDGKLVATRADVDEAAKLWDAISESTFYGVPPQALDFYKTDIIRAYNVVNAFRTNKRGVTYDELTAEYYKRTGCYPNLDMIRKMFIPALQCAGLISYKKDDDDRRQMLITPLVFFDENQEEKE